MPRPVEGIRGGAPSGGGDQRGCPVRWRGSEGVPRPVEGIRGVIRPREEVGFPRQGSHWRWRVESARLAATPCLSIDHSPLEGESAKQGRSPSASRWGEVWGGSGSAGFPPAKRKPAGKMPALPGRRRYSPLFHDPFPTSRCLPYGRYFGVLVFPFSCIVRLRRGDPRAGDDGGAGRHVRIHGWSRQRRDQRFCWRGRPHPSHERRSPACLMGSARR